MTERDEILQALDAALAALENGASLESALAAAPALAAELRPLLLAAVLAGAGSDLPRVPVGAQVASRSQFLAGAADRRPGLAPLPAGGSRPRSTGGWTMAGSSLLARALAVGAVVLAGLGAGGYGVAAASSQSLPGDPLYGVKRTVEGTELLLASDPQTRDRLQKEFDDRRVREAQAVANQGRQVSVEFTGTLISMDGIQSQHWLVSGVAVLVGPQVPVDGQPSVGASVHIQGLVQTAGEVLAERVTVLPNHGPTEVTPTATATATASATAPARASATALATATPGLTSTPIPPTVTASATTAPTILAPVATDTPPATATRPNPPPPSATFVPTATEDHGPSASETPKATENGDHGGTSTPEATEGGGDHGGTGTPEATEGGGDHGGGSLTPEPTDSGGDHGGGSQTPEPTDSGGDHGGGGPSASNTPKPSDGGGGGGGPSASNTPKPND